MSFKESATVFVVAWLFALIPGYLRFVAADEGFYLTAAKLVAQGKVPYIDFFYPQTPYLPYMYAFFFKLCGSSWITARVTTASATGVLALLLYRTTSKVTKRLYAVLAIITLLSSGLTIAWFSVAKAYTLPTLLLLSCYLLVEPSCNKKSSANSFFLAGVLGGCALGSRLLLGPAVFLCFIFTLLSERRVQNFSLFAVGLTLSLAPCLLLFLADQEVFVFNNLGYHQIRSSLTTTAAIQQKLDTIYELFFELINRDGGGVQYLLLAAVSFICVVRTRSPLAYRITILIGVIFITHLTPTPTWTQYFCHTVPFLILLVFTALPKTIQSSKFIKLTFVGGFIIYCTFGLIFYYRYLVTGEGVRGISKRTKSSSRISFLSTVGEVIDSTVPTGTKVLSVWPGYLVGSHAEYVPGFEDQFWLRVGDKLSDEERARYKIADRKTLVATIESGDVPYFLLGKKRIRIEEQSLKNSPYTFVKRVGEVELYRSHLASDPE